MQDVSSQSVCEARRAPLTRNGRTRYGAVIATDTSSALYQKSVEGVLTDDVLVGYQSIGLMRPVKLLVENFVLNTKLNEERLKHAPSPDRS